MMMTNVVKLRKFSRFLKNFSDIIKSDTTHALARSYIRDFTRRRVMTFDMVIFYLMFRNRKNTDADLIKFFCCLDQLEKKVTKQALHKNIRKLNSSVFLNLFNEFAKLFYSSGLDITYWGYTLLAEDGSFLEIPYEISNIYHFGFLENQHIHDMFDVKKIVSKAAALYDVTNGFFVDFTIKNANCSEIPLAFRHLYHTKHLYQNKKVIYLADRYYGSAELIAFLELLGYKYCIRGKSNFYKKQISQMTTNDEWIEINIDDKWLKRFNNSPETIDYIRENPVIKIRVVKKVYTYYDKYGCLHLQEMTYFTNLSKKEFDKRDIEDLYSKRWDIEVAYKVLKTNLELERYVSRNVETTQSSVYAKVLYFNIIGIHRKAINKALLEFPRKQETISDDNYRSIIEYHYYAVNISQLIHCFYDNNILGVLHNGTERMIMKKLYQIFKACEKLKVPIRKNRHNDRWGRVVPSGHYYRFTLDGRNHPKLKTVNGIMRTTNP